MDFKHIDSEFFPKGSSVAQKGKDFLQNTQPPMTSNSETDKSGPRPRQWHWAALVVVATIAFAALFGGSSGSAGKSPKPLEKHSTIASSRPTFDFGAEQKSKPLSFSVNQSNKTGLESKPNSFSASQNEQDKKDGLFYETVIPRSTVKGYYEPKVVPYPQGKPVYVNGYYRKNGTYVRPHFRFLPRR